MEEIKNEYSGLLIELQAMNDQIAQLDDLRNLIDNQRLQMEKRYNFDPKNFVTERINGKDYYN